MPARDPITITYAVEVVQSGEVYFVRLSVQDRPQHTFGPIRSEATARELADIIHAATRATLETFVNTHVGHVLKHDAGAQR